jgi:hypothetical protein
MSTICKLDRSVREARYMRKNVLGIRLPSGLKPQAQIKLMAIQADLRKIHKSSWMRRESKQRFFERGIQMMVAIEPRLVTG